MIFRFRHEAVLALKRILYWRRGEPYQLHGRVLRFLPGSRPVRLRYARSQNGITRYDALQVACLSQILREGDAAVDIGAHHGTYSILMAAKCGSTGRVIAFEPDPYARTVLQRNLSLNSDIRPPLIEACACSNEVGMTTLFSRRGNSQSSLVRSAVEFSPDQKAEAIKVPVVTLDAYLSTHELPNLRCVKIDAEGAEIRILRGAKRVLESDATIVCELHPYAWPDFGDTLDDLKGLAAAARRRVSYLDRDKEIGDHAEYGAVLIERYI